MNVAKQRHDWLCVNLAHRLVRHWRGGNATPVVTQITDFRRQRQGGCVRDWRIWLGIALMLPVICAAASLDETPTLGSQRAWMALLHADDDGLSRVDSDSFFLSPDGHQNPRAEWQATVQEFEREPSLRCRFPARWELMRAEKALAAAPDVDCPAYQQWRQRLNTQGVTLVLASAYLGNPSSTFGHTFLRLDADGNPLLAWAVNFAAQTQDAPGLSYALKGLAGGYAGRFGLGPYYDKVTEYAYLEQRALWEYRLKLNAAEIDFLLAHLWELRDVEFDYFFLDENCSFQLLALLQSVRPNVPLTDGFELFAAPVDTVRRLQRFGLVERIDYRPSLRATLRLRIDQLNDPEREAVQAALDPKGGPMPESPRALETLADLARYRSATGVLGRPPSEVQRSRWLSLENQALQARSQAVGSSLWQVATDPASPDQSHRTQRIVSGVRFQEERSELLLGWRPALHDGLDGLHGLSADSEISVLDTRLGVRAGTWRLHELSLIKVRSLPPRDDWFRPWSWQVGAGYRRELADPQGLWRVEAGLGLSWSYGVTLSLLGQGAVLLGKGGQRGVEHAAEFLLRGHWDDHWPWRLSVQRARRHGQIAGDDDWRTVMRAGQHWQISSRWGLRLQFEHERASREDRWDFSLMRYF